LTFLNPIIINNIVYFAQIKYNIINHSLLYMHYVVSLFP
jgi:hypothetical protein